MVEIKAKSKQVCPRCDSSDFASAGTQMLNVAKFRRYRCRNCGLLYYGEVLRKYSINISELRRRIPNIGEAR